jgi:hypothetical protein
MSISQKHFNVGYALYMAHQPISACKTANQVTGWLSAQNAELAAADCDTSAYLSSNVANIGNRGW